MKSYKEKSAVLLLSFDLFFPPHKEWGWAEVSGKPFPLKRQQAKIKFLLKIGTDWQEWGSEQIKKVPDNKIHISLYHFPIIGWHQDSVGTNTKKRKLKLRWGISIMLLAFSTFRNMSAVPVSVSAMTFQFARPCLILCLHFWHGRSPGLMTLLIQI